MSSSNNPKKPVLSDRRADRPVGDGAAGERPRISGGRYVPGERVSDREWRIGASLTLPAESIPLRELLRRYDHGQEISGSMVHETGSNETDDFDSIDLEKARYLDIFDRAELSAQVKAANDAKLASLKKAEAKAKALKEKAVEDKPSEKARESPQSDGKKAAVKGRPKGERSADVNPEPQGDESEP